MKIDAIMRSANLAGVGELAQQAEGQGFHALLVPEECNDPFLALALAAEHTDRIELGTCVATALPRSPMHLAQVAHDLQTYCRGRLTLGLGPGDRPQLEVRFGVESDEAALRMREAVLALRAIWRAWNDGVPLQFEGRFYRHTLMIPAFDPGPTGWGPPRVFLLACEPDLAEVAGEVADGLFVTGPPTPGHLGDVLLPAVERGLHRSGRRRSEIQISIRLNHPPASAGDLDEQIEGSYRGLADRIVLPLC